jgi:hypothetical protein
MYLMKWHTITAIVAVMLATASTAGAVSYDQETSYNGGGVMIRMSVPMGTVLNAGEELAFKFQTLQDAYVIVFNIDTDGYVHLLHPEQGMSMAAARRTYDVPEGRNSSLIVSGETGIEFVFALSVPSRDWVDEAELAYLFSLDADQGSEMGRTPYRIDGDPFLAANIIAAELVRGISRRPGVFLDFTYFYINERVAYPCYLCGECDRRIADSDCERYQIVADFQRTQPLVYPLTRAYDLVDQGVAISDVPVDRTEVEFYPYRSEVYSYSRPYVYRVADPYFYDPWYWDPWYSGWCYYPGSWPRWGGGWGMSVSVGWGWGWGWGWGGYYCSPYVAPYYGGGGVQPRTSKFKTQYASGGKSFKSGTLVDGYRQSRTRDASAVIAAKGTRSAGSTTAYRGSKSNTSRSGKAAYKRTANYNRGGTTKVSGTRYNGSRTAYGKRTVTRSGSRGGTVTRGGTTTRRQPQSVRRGTRTPTRSKTTYHRPSNTNRSRGSKGTYRTPSSRNRSSVKSAPRRSSGNRSSVRSAPRRSSGNRSSVRSAPRTSTRSRSAVKSSPRRSGNRSSVRSAPRSSPRSSRSGTTRSGGSRSGGSRSGKRR